MASTQLPTVYLLAVLVLGFASLSLACTPTQGFYTIVRFPEVRSKGESLYIYALNTENISPQEEVTINKDLASISSDYVQFGTITSSYPELFGCYVQINLPSRHSDYHKVGTYLAKYSPASGAIQQSLALVKSKTKILDTRGLFSLTVHPASGNSGETRLDHATQAINLKWSPGCDKLRWIKDGRLVNTGRQLKLTKIKDAAGVYNIQQRTRGKRGIFVPFRVLVASCPADMYLNEGSNTCVNRGVTCQNGGVGRDKEDSCICPPYLSEGTCVSSVIFIDYLKEPEFILGEGFFSDLHCSDLPGGDGQCKGMLFCLDDLYGCKCAPGWHGNSCDRLCPPGTWGVDCLQYCPAGCPDCNPFDPLPAFIGLPSVECI